MVGVSVRSWAFKSSGPLLLAAEPVAFAFFVELRALLFFVVLCTSLIIIVRTPCTEFRFGTKVAEGKLVGKEIERRRT